MRQVRKTMSILKMSVVAFAERIVAEEICAFFFPRQIFSAITELVLKQQKEVGEKEPSETIRVKASKSGGKSKKCC